MTHQLYSGIFIYLSSLCLSVSLCVDRLSALLGCLSFGVRSLMDRDEVSLHTDITDMRTIGEPCPQRRLSNVTSPPACVRPLDRDSDSLFQCEWIPVTSIAEKKHFRVTSVTAQEHCRQILERNTLWVILSSEMSWVTHTHEQHGFSDLSLTECHVFHLLK